MPLRDREVRALLQACGDTGSEEIDCEEFLEMMAAYAEALAERRPIPPQLRKAQAHEQLCIHCAEECRALLEVLR